MWRPVCVSSQQVVSANAPTLQVCSHPLELCYVLLSLSTDSPLLDWRLRAMSSAFGGNRGVAPKAPEKGVFPLDHFGECKKARAADTPILNEHLYTQ